VSKLCVECKWMKRLTGLKKLIDPRPEKCGHPTQIDLVTGLATNSCDLLRWPSADCGPRGHLWEAKENG
jgi:hypothetical protein